MDPCAVSVLVGGLHHCDPAWSRPQRFSRELRIYVPVSGAARFAIDDRWTDLRPGRVYFIPGKPTNRQICERAMSVHWLHLAPRSPALAEATARILRIVEWPEARWRWWRPIYRRIAEHVAGGGAALAASVHAFALAVTAEAIAEAAEDAAETPAIAERARLAPALALLERRSPAPVPVPALAREAGLSVAHFRRRFNAAYGCSPRAWIARRRLELAAGLLTADEAPIAEVAAACGYDDAFHFSRAFRRFHRLSPSAFRRVRRRAP